MKQIFDPSKPVQTRDGCPARIVCRDATGIQPILALIMSGGQEAATRHNLDGKYYIGGSPSVDDLVNVPEQLKTTIWVNVYPDGSSAGHDNKDQADQCGGLRIACVQVDITVDSPFSHSYTTKQL